MTLENFNAQKSGGLGPDVFGYSPHVVEVAEHMEAMAKIRLDTANTFTNKPTDAGVAAAKDLAETWAKLDSEDRLAVVSIIRKKYDDTFSALPNSDVIFDKAGNVSGIEFSASSWDFNRGPAAIKIVAEDGQVSESRSTRLHSLRNDSFTTEYITQDKPLPHVDSSDYRNSRITSHDGIDPAPGYEEDAGARMQKYSEWIKEGYLKPEKLVPEPNKMSSMERVQKRDDDEVERQFRRVLAEPK